MLSLFHSSQGPSVSGVKQRGSNLISAVHIKCRLTASWFCGSGEVPFMCSLAEFSWFQLKDYQSVLNKVRRYLSPAGIFEQGPDDFKKIKHAHTHIERQKERDW